MPLSSTNEYDLTMIFSPEQVRFDQIENEITRHTEVQLSVARFDLIHPMLSGNKLFKLKYFADACLASRHRTMLTFGGAYSNHLAAAAFLCHESDIRCIGIVRGEEPKELSHTLLQCSHYGMELHFVSRRDYSLMSSGNEEALHDMFGEFTYVPEGGYAPEGAKGASLMYDLLKEKKPTHIITATGTATTLAGLLLHKEDHQQVISVPVIKNMHDIPLRLKYLLNSETTPAIFSGYEFGGYAKYTDELIAFMNELYASSHIPTDFVYTGKMMFAVTDMMKKGYFEKESRVVCVHTGGLQGNMSLTEGALIF